MAGWERLQETVRLEMVQRGEEGCRINGFAEKLAAAGEDEAQLMQVYRELKALSVAADFRYQEPSALEEIRRLRPEGPRKLTAEWTAAEWRDKFYGAWLGRSAGCALGKPLEYLDYLYGKEGRPGWENVELWFRGADAWPITGYTPEHSRAEAEYGLGLNDWSPTLMSTRESIQFMESDDDIRYTLLGLLLLEQKGLDWDSWDVGKLWHQHLTYSQVCTAETQVYMNFAQETSHLHGDKPADWPHRLEQMRMYLNPYREWIGAAIRADGLAYGAAGHPELAAELGWRDASFSHVKNGIYGEMFNAAMISAAFAEKDNERIIEIGLSEIPSTSRLASDVRQGVEIAKKAKSERELVSKIWDSFSHYDAVHTNNNAALVAAALIYGGDDFEKAIVTSVYGGMDTDCNGATVGSIMGAKLGASSLPQSWIEPLHDTLYADLPGFHPIAISECAERSYQVFLKIRGELSGKL
ncbi:ADP-ribosylglycohydrolase family protein [Paenibacillus monticola]|uniref:ADP-ribosylglycohydrolase family protein n=1 Tax=Paenibacillus monticola TaxID=2666075 RepID=A0A7X2L4F7_9BACL|nr:ADP-ribosylglycohydrolase family protein [Paenibacillus monticola]MRN56424.1 ADP-ribosylglycohydrolase family protein [Paenibacillus monticola]